MNEGKVALLPERGVVSITGPDARTMLQGLVTNDVEQLAEGRAIHAGLLSPQGKILFEFFIAQTPAGYLLDAPRTSTKGLVQRFMLYKLRADVAIADVSSDYTVTALWGTSSDATPAIPDSVIAYADPRLEGFATRILVTLKSDWLPRELGAESASKIDYAAHRIAHGIPAAGHDYDLGDTFVHEALFDQLNGVSFKKGCYVGQEVVSRMQHRGTARKRVVPLNSQHPLPESGTEVRAGAAVIGKLGTVAGNNALGLIRLDRAGEAESKGAPLTAGPCTLSIKLPPWASFTVPTPKSKAVADSDNGG